jgi:Prolipoprotein diacylglyceryl transferase
VRSGDLFLLYLIWYPGVRFWLEFYRTDSWFFPGTPFNVVHIISAIVIGTTITLLIIRHRTASRAAPDDEPAATADDESPLDAGQGAPTGDTGTPPAQARGEVLSPLKPGTPA